MVLIGQKCWSPLIGGVTLGCCTEYNLHLEGLSVLLRCGDLTRRSPPFLCCWVCTSEGVGLSGVNQGGYVVHEFVVALMCAR